MGARLEFRILGPLEVRRNGALVPVGGPRQRALLALLLCNANRVVSRERLIDELLGDQTAAAVDNTLRVQVSRLRKALGGDGEEPRVIARPLGYLLRVGDGELDLHAFEQGVADGRRALKAGDPGAAALVLREAELLWRGRPLADLEFEPFARLEVERLEELRLLALEERIEAELALGSDGELIAEIESLVASYPLRERPREQLMLALYRAGRQADALAAYRQAAELLREELGLQPGRRLQDLERSILEQDSSLDVVPSAGTRVVAPAICPFKGLAFFDRADAEYFCGRERVVTDLVARLVDSPLVGIVGPSGIGKSSLLRAGVLPALSDGVVPGSAAWSQILLRPGERPCAEFEHALDGDPLERVLATLAPGERIVIAVDQLEELFTQCGREDERQAFLDQLLAAARDRQRRALVVVALRADFYGSLVCSPRFAQLLSASHVLVGPMDREDLARAIEQPAERAGLVVERTLVDALVSDVIGEPGGLPLLSTALLELWRARDERTLRYATYRASGGVHGAVARLAEATYTNLGEPQQRVARRLMLRLAGGEEGALVRRRMPLIELVRVGGAQPVLASLTDARLLTVSDGDVELSHEALLREWPRYCTWLEDDRAGRRLHAHLNSTVRDWDAGGRDAGELYRGARLASAIEWAAHHDDELDPLEREFIKSSRLEADRRNRRLRSLLLAVGLLLIVAVIAGALALIKQRSASNEARIALARELGAEAVNEPQLDLAMLMAREAVNLDPSPQTDSSLLATVQRSPTIFATFRLPVNSKPHINGTPQLAVSPDGRTLLVSRFEDDIFGGTFTGGTAGDVLVLQAQTHRAKGATLTDFGATQPPVYSSDGSLLVYPSRFSVVDVERQDTPTIIVRDARTRVLLNRLQFDLNQTGMQMPRYADCRLLIAPDQHTVYCVHRSIRYSTNGDGPGNLGATYAYRWLLPSGRRLATVRIDSGTVLAAALVDAGTRLLVVDAHSVSAFDARSLTRLSTVAISPGPPAPSAAAISPDGDTIAIGSHTGAVSFVDPATGAARPAIGATSTPVSALTYSPDDRSVVSTGTNNVLIDWDPRTATANAVLRAPAEQVASVAFSPNGATLYTATPEGVVFEWDMTGDRSFGRSLSLGRGATNADRLWPLTPPLALAPDGKTFAVSVGPSTVGLFSTQTLQRRATFTIAPKATMITALAFSPTAPELAVGGYSGVLQLWHVAGPPRLERPLMGLQGAAGYPEAIQAIAFSRDGKLLAATNSAATNAPGSYQQQFLATLAIWHAHSGELLSYPSQLDPVNQPGSYDALAISPNGRLLAASVPGGSDVLVDLASDKTLRTLHPLDTEDTTALAFAPNGTLATGALAGIVQLWNPASGAAISSPLAVSAGPVTSIAFNPTGDQFATTGSQNGTAKLWSTSTLQEEGSALNTGPGTTAAAVFEPHGGALLAVNNAGMGFTWPTSLADWEQRACTVAGRNLTPQEWDQYVTGQPYTQVCP